MSYVLQIFSADHVDTVADALASCLGRERPRAPAPEAFARFREALQAGWPGAATDPALPEGLDPPEDGDPVWGLAVDSRRAGENLWRHVGRAAALAGLHVLDPQAGVLLRSDGVLVDQDGLTRQLREPMPWPVETVPVPRWTEPDARRLVMEAAGRVFEPDGFSARVADPWVQFTRSAGDVQQCIEISVSESGREKGSMTLHLKLCFDCPRVRAVWTTQFHDQVAAHMARVVARQAQDFTISADQLEDEPGPLSMALGGRKYPSASTPDELVAWVDQVRLWYDAVGRSALARMTTVAGLAQYVLNAQQMRWMYLNDNLAIEEQLSRLVMAGAFQPERLDEWLAALRDHRRRRRLDPRFGKDLFVPNRAAVFDALATWVASTPFASEADRLKA